MDERIYETLRARRMVTETVLERPIGPGYENECGGEVGLLRPPQ